jgi:hypothetical protein
MALTAASKVLRNSFIKLGTCEQIYIGDVSFSLQRLGTFGSNSG